MWPIINFGFFHIPSYALLSILGGIFFTITTIFLFEKREKIPSSLTNRLLILSIFGFLILTGSAFVMNSLFHSIEKGRLVIGGITWLGGVLFAFPSMLLLIHKLCPQIKGEALKHFNLLIPGIVLAHGFGRVGCFLGGCCYGKVTSCFLGVSFPEGSLAANQYPALVSGSLPVFPTQLFEAFFEFALFLVMVLLYKRLKDHFLETYAFSYGTFRFLLEFCRGDDRGITGLFLSPSQLMSIMLIIMGAMTILYHKRIIFSKLHTKMDQHLKFRNAVNDHHLANILNMLKTLVDESVITKDEFEAKKAELLKKHLN